MTLTEMLNEVYIITKRPDKVTDSTSALKAALFKMHSKDFYSKDIIEIGVAFDTSSQFQSFAYKTLFPLWRAVSYIQPMDSITGLPSGDPLVQINPQFTVDDYDVYKDGVYYEAGLTLQMRMTAAFQYFGIGYYQYPDISSTSQLTTWIAQDFPWALIYDAAAMIFKSIGFTDQEASMRGLVQEQMRLIDISSIQATGY